MHKLIRFYSAFLDFLNKLNPLMLLMVRLFIAHIFWASGILKINDWNNTIYLFTHEHPVPYLTPQIAAIFGTTFEICCPILLALGLATRLTAIPLLVMTAVINFTYENSIEHYYWTLLLGTILFVGPGKLSLDYVISRKLERP